MIVLEPREPVTNKNVEQWAEALRSGVYKQWQGDLVWGHASDGPKYCCLGVKIVLERGTCEAGDPYYLTELRSKTRNFFVWLNDEMQLTFNQIALVIDNLPQEEWFQPEEK